MNINMPADPQLRNSLVRALKKAMETTLSEADWIDLGYLTNTREWIVNHDRLLRSLRWQDPDYGRHVYAAVERILEQDPANLQVLLEFGGVGEWIRVNQPALYEAAIGSALPVVAGITETQDSFGGGFDQQKQTTRGPVAAQHILTADQRQYLQTIFDYFHEHGRWPTYRYLERRMIIEGDFDARQIAHDLPYVVPSMSSDVSWNPEREAMLSVPAMALCRGAESELTLFIAALKLAVGKYLSSDDPSPRVTSGEAKETLHADDLALGKLAHLIRCEPCWYASLGTTGEAEWDFAISPDIVRYRKVESLADYLEIRSGQTLLGPMDHIAWMQAASQASADALDPLPTAPAEQVPARAGTRGRIAIFVSYRRDDSAGSAGRLHADLTRRFGEHPVFMDVTGLEPGVEWQQELRDALTSCKVFLAIIGKHWLTTADPGSGRRRLDMEGDWVRRETAEALRRGIRVIPVLVDGAQLPKADDLPDDLRPLVGWQSHEITSKRWDYDTGQLMKVMEAVIGDPPAQVVDSRASAPLSQEAIPSTGSTRYSDPTLSVEAQKILHFLVRSYPPEATVSGEVVEQAVGIQGMGLSDALHELEEAGLIRDMRAGISQSPFATFMLNVSAWTRVDASVVGFDVAADMVTVATAASNHDQIERDALLAETGLPDRRLDIAALLLKDRDLVGIIRPLVRGLTFSTLLTSYKTRTFAKSQRRTESK
jgi:hypothetical protein